jgi:hypothetical protein
MEDYGTMTVTFGVLDMNIDNEITACPVQGAVCSTGGLHENDSNLRVRDTNIDTGITDGLPVYSSASMMRGLQENDSYPGVRDMKIDTGITGYLLFHKMGAYYGVDCGKMTVTPGCV